MIPASLVVVGSHVTNNTSSVSSCASSPSSVSFSIVSTLSNMSSGTRLSSTSSSLSQSNKSANRSIGGGVEPDCTQVYTSPRKVRIDTGTTIINQDSCSYMPVYVANLNSNGNFVHKVSNYDYDQHSSSSSNSSVGFHSPARSLAALNNKTLADDNGSSSSRSSRLQIPDATTNVKNVNVDTVENRKSTKSRTSPKQLLYEVLLSPIKRKSRTNNRSSQKVTMSNKMENVQEVPTSKSGKSSMIQTSINSNTTPVQATTRSSSTTPLDRNYFHMQMSNQSSLFDDDPGIMSEIETSATGFRRGNKVRSSLPIVRTPSKSQDRSLGLVFLQFRSETKRALLPNEITSIDTVKALFVRSFPRQLTMEYLDHISVRIYIHDPSKDMFYELEDLRDVKDRSILRIYEQGVNGPQPGGGGLPIPTGGGGGGGGGVGPHDGGESYGYFSEPEFDSEFQSQHIHRKRFPPSMLAQSLIMDPNTVAQSQYYGTVMLPPQYRSATLGMRPGFITNQNMGGHHPPPPQPPTRSKAYPGYSQTLPRGTHLMSPSTINASINNPFGIPNATQPTSQKPQRPFAPSPGPQTGLIVIQGHPARPTIAAATMTPSSASVPQHLAYHQSRPLPDRPYSVAGQYPTPDRVGARIPYPQGAAPNNMDFSGYLSSPEHRPNATMIAMHAGQAQQRSSFSSYPTARPFEAEMAGVYPHAPIYPRAPSAAIIDPESRVRMQEMERQIASLTNVVSKALGSTSKAGTKPAPPPKPQSLIGHRSEPSVPIPTDNASQLRLIRRRARELKNEVRSLKRFTIQQTNLTKESLKETCNKIKSTLSFLSSTSEIQMRLERLRVGTDREAYNNDISRLDKDLLQLEAQVEELRSNVINRRCRVNISNVESMAIVLSRASKTVADLKARYPSLAQRMKTVMTKELQQIDKEERFIKDEPDRLEQSLKRCKKLTGTLVTLKRLASVQEQRSSTNTNTCSPSQLLQSSSDKKDSSLDEGFGGSGPDSLLTRAKRMQAWRRSAHFRQHLPNNYKIDLCRGFASMPTIQEPNVESIDGESEQQTQCTGPGDNDDDIDDDKSGHHRPNIGCDRLVKHSLMSKSYDADLMEPHTIIQVTPATPSSTDSSKTSATSNILDNLLDELQTFSKQSSIESPISTATQRSLRSLNKQLVINNSDTIIRKARSKSYSSLRANSEPPGTRSRGASIPDGNIDLDSIALLASQCGPSAAATALMEKRFAQSRQELLEQRHQELLRKQRQLQEQYTRLQQLSRGQLSRSFLNDLKKTGSESNLASKAGTVSIDQTSKINRVPSSSTVHGSLKNLANNNNSSTPSRSTQSGKSATLGSANKTGGDISSHQNGSNNASQNDGKVSQKKVFETEIL